MFRSFCRFRIWDPYLSFRAFVKSSNMSDASLPRHGTGVVAALMHLCMNAAPTNSRVLGHETCAWLIDWLLVRSGITISRLEVEQLRSRARELRSVLSPHPSQECRIGDPICWLLLVDWTEFLSFVIVYVNPSSTDSLRRKVEGNHFQDQQTRLGSDRRIGKPLNFLSFVTIFDSEPRLQALDIIWRFYQSHCWADPWQKCMSFAALWIWCRCFRLRNCAQGSWSWGWRHESGRSGKNKITAESESP